MAMKGIGASCIIFMIVSIRCIHSAFTPADNYLIDCGSLTNTTIYNRIFVSDVSVSSTLTPSSNNLANTSGLVPASTYGAALYQNARVFTVVSSYSFKINAHGRHFVRLYFFPSVYGRFDLTSATFTVSTQDVVLLDHFRPQANSAIVEEFLVNIDSDTLALTFAPTSGNNYLAFVNAIEVVSVPETLIAGSYHGLSGQLLQKIYRLNMGGPQVYPNNDTLWRTWDTDQKSPFNNSLSVPVIFSGTIHHMEGGATQETAPDPVYATAARLDASNTTNAKFNMTWQFPVDANSAYLIRFHFCDIVSRAAGDLLFDVYINYWLVASNLDLSTITFGQLQVPVYMDYYVLEASDASGTELNISIGPSDINGVSPDGILNGLEIMKIVSGGHNSAPCYRFGLALASRSCVLIVVHVRR